MKTLPVILSLLVPALTTISTVTLAQAPQPGKADPLQNEARLKAMTEHLGLSDEQQAKIKAIYEKTLPEIQELVSKGTANLSVEEKTRIKMILQSQETEITAELTAVQKKKMQQGRAVSISNENDARIKMMIERLDLSEEQQKKILSILEKNTPQFKELQAKGPQNLTDENKAKIKEIHMAQTEEINSVLTAEQKEKMRSKK